MNKILEFLIKFINGTHLDDHIEMIHEVDDDGNVVQIVINKVRDDEFDTETYQDGVLRR